MPTYTYACRDCHHRLEVVQSMKDAALTDCPRCEGPLRKVFEAVGVAFRGPGFYRTDSRADPPPKPGSPSKPSSDSPPASDAGSKAPSGAPTPAKEPA